MLEQCGDGGQSGHLERVAVERYLHVGGSRLILTPWLLLAQALSRLSLLTEGSNSCLALKAGLPG